MPKPRRRWVIGGLLGAALLASAGVLLGGLWSGFEPGAGGADEMPAEMSADGSLKLRLRLSVWGGGGAARGRYQDVVLKYRSVASEPYRRVPGRLLQAEEKAETYGFTVARGDLGAAGPLDYAFELRLDGQPATIAGKQSIMVPPSTPP
jgi:hypothetical protein